MARRLEALLVPVVEAAVQPDLSRAARAVASVPARVRTLERAGRLLRIGRRLRVLRSGADNGTHGDPRRLRMRRRGQRRHRHCQSGRHDQGSRFHGALLVHQERLQGSRQVGAPRKLAEYRVSVGGTADHRTGEAGWCSQTRTLPPARGIPACFSTTTCISLRYMTGVTKSARRGRQAGTVGAGPSRTTGRRYWWATYPKARSCSSTRPSMSVSRPATLRPSRSSTESVAASTRCSWPAASRSSSATSRVSPGSTDR